MRKIIFGAAALLLAGVSSHAQQNIAAKTILIHAGRLLAVPGQPPRGNTTLTIVDGKITAVTDGFTAATDPSVQVINLENKFVLPGLIDSHVHLTSDAGGVAAQLEGVTKSPPELAFQAAANGRKTLMAGFTTVRNLGDGDGVVLALRDAINAGAQMGPRILDAGMAISATSGHTDDALGYRDELRDYFSHGGNTCDGADGCRKAVRLQIGRGVDVIKMAITGGVNSRIGTGLGKQMFDDEAQAIVDTAKLYGKKVAVHAHGADGVNLALRAGADSIEHGTLLDEESIKLFLKTGAYYVPTLSTVNGYIERLAKDPNAYAPAVKAKVLWRIQVTGESLKKSFPRGVKIAFGTDAGVSKHGRNADEFELMVKYGMPAAAAIKAATVTAAELLGLSADIGTLEVGKRADIIAVSGDPLQDVTVLKSVQFVMTNGVVAKE